MSPLPAAPPARRYAYSLDREVFRGSYDSRRAAVAAAETALKDWPAMAEAIWVGRLVATMPRLDDLAETVLDELRDRPVDGDPLADATDAQRDDLDTRLADLVREWIGDHHLAPPPRVEEISEHALPLIEHVTSGREREVELIGTVG
jgi:hypothetical protein